MESACSSIVRLNVGGTPFTTSRDTLLQDRDSMLARMFSGELAPGAVDETGAVFIDRDPKHFATILNFLRTGKLVFSSHKLEQKELLLEAEFYGLSQLQASLQPRAAILYAHMMESLLSQAHHVRAMDRLWKVAFPAPLTPAHACGSWVDIAYSAARCSLRGPSCELVVEATQEAAFKELTADVEYVFSISETLLPSHFEGLGLRASVHGYTPPWKTDLNRWTIKLAWDKSSWVM